MKVAIIQTADQNTYVEMLNATAANIAAYCDRHDLERRTFTGVKRGLWDWHSCFNRLYLFEELMGDGDVDWALYLDVDAYVVDLNFPIRQYLSGKSELAGIVAHSGVTPAAWDINNGVMFLNLKNPTAKLMVQDWIRRHEEIFDEPEYLSPERPVYFGDQRLLQHVLRDNPDWCDALHMESKDLINSMHARFIRHHLRAMTPDFRQRLDAIRRDVDDVARRHFLGDCNAQIDRR